MAGRNVPVRIASGVVEVHGSAAIQPVVAVAAHKRHGRSNNPLLLFYYFFFLFFDAIAKLCGGCFPRSPSAAYAALGILQERPGATFQFATPAV